METVTPILPASYHDCRTLAERAAWLQEENRRRCEAAAARKAAEEPVAHEEWTLNPPAR